MNDIVKKNTGGPLTPDLVVACAIHHLEKEGKETRSPELNDLLNGMLMPPELLSVLDSLAYWGIVRSEYTSLESGRSGRVYFITDEAHEMVRGVYNLYWERIKRGLV